MKPLSRQLRSGYEGVTAERKALSLSFHPPTQNRDFEELSSRPLLQILRLYGKFRLDRGIKIWLRYGVDFSGSVIP
ncbi:MAG: hypothetical protein DSZ24_04170 [Thermodesulfatator sp.]|nr:MAG: hypothetical protein DSZ24_04170 [Thermodesulfatator sp.]